MITSGGSGDGACGETGFGVGLAKMGGEKAGAAFALMDAEGAVKGNATEVGKAATAEAALLGADGGANGNGGADVGAGFGTG